jgi:integrase
VPVRRNIFDNPAALNLTPRQTNKVLGPLLEFLERHQPQVGKVLLGDEAGAWTAKDMRRLESLLIKEIEDPGVVLDDLRVLRKAAAFWGLREGLKLELPRIPLLTPHPKAPFRGNLPRALARYAAWKAVLNSWLREAEKGRKFQKRRGPAWAIEPVVVSAILHGGLINMASVLALVRAIPDLEHRAILTEAGVHVELLLPWRGIPDMELRRWQPDALTATLLANIPANAAAVLLAPEEQKGAPVGAAEGDQVPDDRTLAGRLGSALQEALKRDPANKRTKLGGIYALLRAAQVVAHLELPGIVASYAARNLVSHSLPRSGLKRLSPGARMLGADGPRLHMVDRKTTISNVKLDGEDQAPEWFLALRSSIEGKDRDKVRMELGRLSKDTTAPPFLCRMADFGDSLLAVRTVSGKMLSPHAARDIVLPLARNLGRFAEDADPAALSTEALELLYGQAMESTGPLQEANAERGDLARALFEFHRYMMARYGKEPIEGQDNALARVPSEMAAVDANLLTLEEYRTTLRTIEEEWPVTDALERKQIARVLVILGFRCGLRRREALYMLVQDMLLDGPAELLVRPSEMRGLKSNNARRRLPLAVLLTPEELQEVSDWWNYRVVAQQAAPTDCLFGNTREGLGVVPQSIFEQINSILHRVTNNNTFHYHHLRHSFATWTLLRLILADWQEVPDFFPQLPDTTTWLKEGQAFRRELYGHALPTRKHGYLLAGLLGHGNPATSMENYVHLLDWVLAACLERSSAIRPDNALVAMASGRSRSTIQRWTPETKGRTLQTIARKLWIEGFPKYSTQPTRRSQANSASEIKAPAPDLQDRVDWAERAWDFLYTAETSGRPLEELARRFQLEDNQAEAMLERARALRAMKTGNGANRHKMEISVPDRRAPEHKKILACPRRPLQGPDKEVMKKYSMPLRQLADTNPALVQSALRLCAHHLWSREDLVLFHHPDKDPLQAKTYLEFLISLGLSRNDIWLVSYDQGDRSRWRARWKKELGPNQYHPFEKRNAPNKASEAARSWLGIAPQFHLCPAANKDKNPGSLGFYFLLLMGQIVYGRL